MSEPQRIRDILKEIGIVPLKTKKVVIKDVLSPEEKKSEHQRRVEWLEKMARTPECCRTAKNMVVWENLYHCLYCGRTYEDVCGIMVCIS